MGKKELPIGIQSFREVREGGYYYADKTAHAERLIAKAKHNLLSRPRRFGKTLLVDTLKEMFEGNEKLFRGLAIHDQWDWTVKHPVLRLDFSKGEFTKPGQLHASIVKQLTELEDGFGVKQKYESESGRLSYLISELVKETGQPVVFLVDEYDKPILDALGTPELAEANRRKLIGIYSITKVCGSDIYRSLLTGVSQIILASALSGGVNNLVHSTIDHRCSSICGYTDHDLDTVFAQELDGLDREKIREWYGGYGWSGDEKMYNPHNIMQLCAEREFKSRWFEDCTPSFLVDALKREGAAVQDPDGAVSSSTWLMIDDVEDSDVTSLLFHTGYLTVTGEEGPSGHTHYILGYPNRDVRESLMKLPLKIQVR